MKMTHALLTQLWFGVIGGDSSLGDGRDGQSASVNSFFYL